MQSVGWLAGQNPTAGWLMLGGDGVKASNGVILMVAGRLAGRLERRGSGISNGIKGLRVGCNRICQCASLSSRWPVCIAFRFLVRGRLALSED